MALYVSFVKASLSFTYQLSEICRILKKAGMTNVPIPTFLFLYVQIII